MSRLCLGVWSDHGERTGGFYACNRYEAAKQEGVVMLITLMMWWAYAENMHNNSLLRIFIFLYSSQYDESEKRREMAKNSLERYTHYYERWATNQSVWSSFYLNLHFCCNAVLINIKANPYLTFFNGVQLPYLHLNLDLLLLIEKAYQLG